MGKIFDCLVVCAPDGEEPFYAVYQVSSGRVSRAKEELRPQFLRANALALRSGQPQISYEVKYVGAAGQFDHLVGEVVGYSIKANQTELGLYETVIPSSDLYPGMPA